MSDNDVLLNKEDDDNDFYGSLGNENFSIGSRGEGGLISGLPTEGYCMVFESESKMYKLTIKGDILRVDKADDVEEAEFYENGWHLKFKRMENLLKNFKEANIQYRMIRSNDRAKKWIYVIVTCKKSIAEEWADRHNIDIEIDPVEAIKCGRKFGEFHLARRTYLPQVDGDETHFEDQYSEDKNKPSDNEDDIDKMSPAAKPPRRFKKLPLECWKGIHIAYETTIDRKVYKKIKHRVHHGAKHNDSDIIGHRLYLRLLYEMLTDDVPLGGANFIITKYLQNPNHPLKHFFALHQSEAYKPEFTHEKCFKMRTPKENLAFVDEIRAYYGENIGFYFSFLVHYTKWLYPMAAIGFIWFIVQLSFGIETIAVPGSTLIILIAIMWSTMMIENWYRREWKLRFKWGMMRYEQTEIPRPTFKGVLDVSREDGTIVETYSNWWKYCCKVTCSLSTMLLCICVVIGCVIGLFLLRGQNRNDQMLSIGIGMANSVQIFIMNKLYTVLAYKLNEWEGHRLQQEYYNNLVIKRIIFIVVNSFNSLFYLAFFDDNPIYDDDKARLQAVRIQLVTLFVTALVIQNCVEVLLPWIITKVKRYLSQKEEDDYISQDGGSSSQASYQEDALLSDDQIEERAKVHVVDAGDDNIHIDLDEDVIIRRESELGGQVHVNQDVLFDIRHQIQLGPSPDVLDNTAEVVILHGYIMLFVVIFPLMPFLAAVNNYFELRIDFYNLIHAQRPIPMSAAGLGVWKTVMSCFNIVAIFSNLLLVTFRTDLISELLADVNWFNLNLDGEQKLIIFFFSASLILLFIIFVIRVVIDDKTASTREAIARQEACERYLIMAPVTTLAKKTAQEQRIKASQKHLPGINELHADDDEKHEL